MWFGCICHDPFVLGLSEYHAVVLKVFLLDMRSSRYMVFLDSIEFLFSLTLLCILDRWDGMNQRLVNGQAEFQCGKLSLL